MLDVPTFFLFLADYLGSRSETLVSFGSMASPELWLSLEAAALLDRNRQRFGLDETMASAEGRSVPRWAIAPERKKIDIWIADHQHSPPRSATAIEFKCIYNNKNFHTQVRSIRRDFAKALPPTADGCSAERWGIAMLLYIRYLPSQQGGYAYLTADRKPVDASKFCQQFEAECRNASPWFGGASTLSVQRQVRICSLEDAHYVEPGHDSHASLVLLGVP